MKKLFKTALVAVLGAGLLLSGCSSQSASSGSSNADKIVIGGNFEITGGVAQYGHNGSKGVEMAVAEINAKGGLLGKEVEIGRAHV